MSGWIDPHRWRIVSCAALVACVMTARLHAEPGAYGIRRSERSEITTIAEEHAPTYETFDRALLSGPPAPVDVAPLTASPALAGPQAWEWHALPEGLLFRPYLAGPKEPRFASAWLVRTGGGWFWDATLGGRVGLVRFGTPGSIDGEGWQLDLEGSAMTRLYEDTDLQSVDFQFGIPLTWAQGPWQFKVAYSHISSHLGDEFMIDNPGVERINYVRDSTLVGTAYQLTPDIRVYGEVGYAFATSGGAEPWEFQFGTEYLPEFPTGRYLMPFAAAHVNLREEFDFGGNLNVMAGWRWRGTNSGRLLRFGLQYFNGKSSQYAFFNDHEELVGGGIWFDY